MNTNIQVTPAIKGRSFTGKVVSDKMKDTIVVRLSRFVKHQKYGKFMTLSKRVKVHDPGNLHKVGETVEIIECRPLSKDKHFRILTTKPGEGV